MIPFDPTKYGGYIFDCDGTLADAMPLHYRAWNETCEKFTASDSKCQT
jgi:beta-phosphoglucomutase-like phosphatase (HAD superfamily)